MEECCTAPKCLQFNDVVMMHAGGCGILGCTVYLGREVIYI